MDGIDVEPMGFSAVSWNVGSPGHVRRFRLVRPHGGESGEGAVGDAVKIVEVVQRSGSDAARVIRNLPRPAGGAAEMDRLGVIIWVAGLETIPTTTEVLPFTRRFLVSGGGRDEVRAR